MAELEIGDLVLNVPGLAERDAEALGRLVAEALAERLADRLASTVDRRVASLDLRLPPTTLKGPALAAWIADRVAGAVP